MYLWTIRNCINVCKTWAILWEIISSDAWWIVYYGMCTVGSGDVPQGPYSLINDVAIMDVFVLIQIPYPLQFGARDQDCILAKRMG